MRIQAKGEPMKQRFAAIPLLIAVLLFSSCGGGFPSQLRLILAASGPLIQSLPLPESAKSGLVVDFSDLAQGAGNLGDDLKACGDSKPCKLNAIDRFAQRFWDIERRGHFKLSPKLENVQKIIAGIIASARIYYGGSAPSAGNAPARVVTEEDLKSQLEELKVALRP